MVAIVGWSQLIDATLYLRGKDGVYRWIDDFVEDLLRQRRRSYGIAGNVGSRSRQLAGLLVSPRRLFAISWPRTAEFGQRHGVARIWR